MGKGKGWHGDSAGHARAARRRGKGGSQTAKYSTKSLKNYFKKYRDKPMSPAFGNQLRSVRRELLGRGVKIHKL